MHRLRSGIISAPYNATYTLHASAPSAPTCSTSLRALSPRDHRCRKTREGKTHRGYATIAVDDSSSIPPDFKWPDAPKGHSCPTPYQIFDLSRNAPYTKARFYQLVKLYHPDRSGHDQIVTTPNTIKLERYRLIVAAHDILSDPVKRSAYDRWGAGWAGRAEAPSVSDTPGHRPGPFSGWRDHSDPHIWNNATWEDWERWRNRNDPHAAPNQQTGPVFMSNTYFLSVILVFAAVGSSWNFNRADNEGERFLAARDAIHDKASKELRKVRQDGGQRAKDERIQYFLRNREATLMGLGVEELREEKAKRWLPEQDSCMGEDMRTKDSE